MSNTAKIHNPCVRNRTRRYASASAFIQWMTWHGLAPDQLSASERKEAARHGMFTAAPYTPKLRSARYFWGYGVKP